MAYKPRFAIGKNWSLMPRRCLLQALAIFIFVHLDILPRPPGGRYPSTGLKLRGAPIRQ